MNPSLTSLMALLALVIISCAPQPSGPITNPMLACQSDADCICDGILKETGDCFLGNKEWAEDKVDFTRDCPDFCTGIAGHLETKCVDHECRLVSRLQGEEQRPPRPPDNGAECTSNDDCAATGCSGQLCVSRTKMEKNPIMTTCDWHDEYECLKETNCGCIEGHCIWDITPGYAACMERLNPSP